MRSFFLSLIAALLTACGGGGSDAGAPSAPSKPSQTPPPLKVFILVGQSNMLGADALVDPTTGVKDLAELGLQTAVDQSTAFTFSTRAIQAPWGDVRGHAGYWLSEPQIGNQTVKVMGPEVGFSRELGGNIAIVKYADNYLATEGGRSAWVKPGSRWTEWQNFVDQRLAAIGQPYEVAGFVWFQGIDDGFLGRGQEAYAADLRKVLADLRSKFGDKPAVIVQELNSVLVGPTGMAPIRAAQNDVAKELRNAIVDVDGLPLATAHHLSGTAQLEVGRRVGVAMKRLQGVTQ